MAADLGKAVVPARIVHTGPGSSDRMSQGPKRGRLWTVRWQRADLSVGSGDQQSGKMETVTGEIYRDNVQVNTFSSETGNGAKPNHQLILSGNVKVIGLNPKGTLTCNNLVYDGLAKVLRAKGSVVFDGPTGIVGPVSELWASPDLKEIATPTLFNKR